MSCYKPLPYVYRLVHKESGKFYIGYREANKLPAINDLPLYRSSSSKVRKLGFTNFDWEIIAELQSGSDAYDLEQRLIEQSRKDPLCLNGHYTKAGKLQYRRVGPHTKETKIKQSLAKIGVKFSETHKQNMKLAQLGKKQSKETIEKRMVNRRGVNLSKDHRQKISITLQNHLVSEETKNKLSVAAKNQIRMKHCDETKKKISIANIGKKHSEETKLKMSLSHQNLPGSRSESWIITAPNGVIFQIKNKTQFCKDHNLPRGLGSNPTLFGRCVGWKAIKLNHVTL